MSDDENIQRDAVADYVIALMAAALHGERAGDKPAAITWEQVWRLVSRHAIAPMTFPALSEGAVADMLASVSEGWQRAADMALFQQVGYDVDRETILADFREAGLSWIPLKGIMVATYYPHPGMRSMSDQDIVVGFVEPDGKGGYRPRGRTDEERARWARNADEVENSVMAKLGYRELSDVGREHSFGKATLHFELHRSLLDAAELAKGQAYRSELDYYANPWNLAKPTETVPGEFRFDLADEYVFHIDHMSKHYRGSGFGLRFLADEYVYCMRFPDTVGSRLVAERLQKLGLDYFEHAVRELSVLIFRHPEDWRERVGTEELALLEDVLSGGTYGSLERRVGRRLAGAVAGQSDGKLKVTMDGEAHTHTFRYIRNRLFPPKAWVEAYYPAWSRNAFTRFLLLFHRIKEGLRERPALLRRELELLFKRR